MLKLKRFLVFGKNPGETGLGFDCYITSYDFEQHIRDEWEEVKLPHGYAYISKIDRSVTYQKLQFIDTKPRNKDNSWLEVFPFN